MTPSSPPALPHSQRTPLLASARRLSPVLLLTGMLAFGCGPDLGEATAGTMAAVGAPGPWVDITPPISLAFEDFGGMNYGALTIALSEADPSIVYVGTCYQGIWRTEDAGESWAKVSTGRNGENLDTGRNWTVAVSPDDPNVVYTTSGFGFEQGIWQSTDGGVNWHQLMQPSLIAATTNDIYSIAIDPDDPSHLLAGSHSGWAGQSASGVLESRNGGRTWVAHQPEPSWGTGHYVFFIDPVTWLLATQDDGTWRTSDAGSTWEQVSGVGMQHGASQLYRASEGTLYLGAYRTILRSTDRGLTWEEVGPHTQDGYNAIVGDGEFLYALAANTGMNSVHEDPPWVVSRETDGRSWSPQRDAQILPNGPMAMVHDPERNVIYASNWGAGVFRLDLDDRGDAQADHTDGSG